MGGVQKRDTILPIMMYLLVRPSKIFLFKYVQSILSKETGAVGVDAAADRLRNRHLFKTKEYFGFDINQTALERGLRSNPGEDTHGVLIDLVDLTGIPSGCADVVLSSNTLYQISDDERGSAVSELARITAPSGVCVLEFTKDEKYPEMEKIIEEMFEDVRVVYFKNPISYVYERFAYAGGKERSYVRSKPFLVLSQVLSWFEYLTKSVEGLNRHAVVIARGKRDGARGELSTSVLDRLGDRLFVPRR